MNAIFGALGRGVVRFRWLIVIIWVVGTIFAVKTLPTLASQVNNNNSDFLPTSAPSEKAAELAQADHRHNRPQPVEHRGVTSGAALSTEDFAAAEPAQNQPERGADGHRRLLLRTLSGQPSRATPCRVLDGSVRPDRDQEARQRRAGGHRPHDLSVVAHREPVGGDPDRGRQPGAVEEAEQPDPGLHHPVHPRAADRHLPRRARPLRHPAPGTGLRARPCRARSSGRLGRTASRSPFSRRSC